MIRIPLWLIPYLAAIAAIVGTIGSVFDSRNVNSGSPLSLAIGTIAVAVLLYATWRYTKWLMSL